LDIKGTNFIYTDRSMDLDDAWIKDKDTTITADHMHFDKDAAGKWERIVATGKPKAWDERNEVTGEKMTVYPKERRVVVEGHFRVEVKPKAGDEPSEDKSDLRGQVKDGTMTGDRLEYDYRNKNVAAQGNLKMVSRGRTATGEKLFYTEKTDEVQFFGPVHARDEKGQPFDTPTGLTLSLKKEGVSRVPGKFTATLFVEEQEEEPAATSPDAKAPGAPTPAEGKAKRAAAVPSAPAAPDRPEQNGKQSP
jgi:lipopolysaccharide export system protein LptA